MSFGLSIQDRIEGAAANASRGIGFPFSPDTDFSFNPPPQDVVSSIQNARNNASGASASIYDAGSTGGAGITGRITDAVTAVNGPELSRRIQQAAQTAGQRVAQQWANRDIPSTGMARFS